MPPEELEKMHHIEKHIRKNKMKVGAGRHHERFLLGPP
jgi:hypothetical protein